MATIFPGAPHQYFTNAGDVAALYLLDTFASGTTDPETTWTDADEVGTNANPIVLDAAGRAVIFGDPTKLYTLRLRTPGGATVWTRDGVAPMPEAEATQFLPLDPQDAEMLSRFSLVGDATSALNPVPLQQLEAELADAAAATTTEIAAAVDEVTLPTQTGHEGHGLMTDGTDADWDAEAGRCTYLLAAGAGGSASRSVFLTAGTWTLALFTSAAHGDGGGNYASTATQTAEVATITGTASNSIDMGRSGGSGHARTVYGVDVATATLTVATAGTYTFQINAASNGGDSNFSFRGSYAILDRS